jgi:mannose-6-phosphate isomerase
VPGEALYDERPWGRFEVLLEDESYKVKRITVLPGKRLSYQRHARRSEHWFVVQGTACVTLDDDTIELVVGQTADIPVGSAHRIENSGTEDLVFVEIQHGEYFGEDDIERIADDFGRARA